jgi:TolB protein
VALGAFASLNGVHGQQPAATPPQPPQQQSVVELRITGPGGTAPRLAVAGFTPLSNDAETVAAAKTITDVLWDDIAYEREYYMIPKDAIASVPKHTSIDNVPLDRYKELNADGVVAGTVRRGPTGIIVQVRLIQVSTGTSAFGKEYSGSAGDPRRYAHTIWDEMYKDQMQGRGVARTRLTFSSDRGAERLRAPVNRDVQEIYIADYDGANPRKVTNTATLNITPTWSPDSRAIAYTSYRPSGGMGTFQDIVLSYIATGDRRTPADGNPSKQNYLPVWSPDGSKIAFTTNRDGNPEIYVMNADGSGVRRMTNSPSIDVTPTWSPNGGQIAWVSDRTGPPKIYIMNADGTGQRVLGGDSYCDRPTWSSAPFNEIAYATRTGPGYDIKIYSFATGQTTKVTDGIGSNESPAFSPNGRHLAFTSTRNGKVQIYTIARDGNDLRQITREGNNKFPNWSMEPK